MTEKEEPDGPEMATVHLLRRVAVEFSLRQAEFASRNGMHPTDVRALICLLDASRSETPATAGWLGAQLGLNSAGTTALIDRLVRLGHVTRTRDALDRRRVLLTVDARAVERGQEFFGDPLARMADVLRAFDDREAAAVRRFLLEAHTALAARPD
ncbi:MarR family winged helix-turn-helix transcriptional regulator [Streptomyces sp. NBC_00059]|uniref:MarR family winged helix-turn-helix transcriptional regulator n=1 Tax=Streptomyces sp. NBC_00059 TaxID=2975635 RepID=UPI00225C20A9|nr:MarR family transcriptional regulator [Streptomyces sp. NBC_00059]MCX5413047.1 MarR family transcriptional regulator [Streptomyces sp. NBC_00059]